MATFVLIHGAYQGGWIWSPVATRLSVAGHRVYAPSLDGCAERSAQARPGITTETQAEEIAELLRYEDLDQVVLVGTSSGGMVLARVAELARERIQRLVLVDALALLDGEKIRDVVTDTAAITDDVVTGPCPAECSIRCKQAWSRSWPSGPQTASGCILSPRSTNRSSLNHFGNRRGMHR